VDGVLDDHRSGFVLLSPPSPPPLPAASTAARSLPAMVSADALTVAAVTSAPPYRPSVSSANSLSQIPPASHSEKLLAGHNSRQSHFFLSSESASDVAPQLALGRRGMHHNLPAVAATSMSFSSLSPPKSDHVVRRSPDAPARSPNDRARHAQWRLAQPTCQQPVMPIAG
jgi:hypothetical protein